MDDAKEPVYHSSIIRDYFQDWIVLAQTASGMIRKDMMCNVPQGSVLESLPWSITFDEILKEDVPLAVSIICYIDDTMVVMVEDNIPMLEWKVNITLEAMTCWIESARLSLAITNMEVVLFTCHHWFSSLPVCLLGVGDKALRSSEVFVVVIRQKADF